MPIQAARRSAHTEKVIVEKNNSQGKRNDEEKADFNEVNSSLNPFNMLDT